jgi:hypothetical protein
MVKISSWRVSVEQDIYPQSEVKMMKRFRKQQSLLHFREPRQFFVCLCDLTTNIVVRKQETRVRQD